MVFDFNKCKICNESRCILSTPKEVREQQNVEKIIRDDKIRKITAYWRRERKYWTKFAHRESLMINDERYNESDIRHNNNFDIATNKILELDNLFDQQLTELYNY